MGATTKANGKVAIESRPVDDLKPNEVNGRLFTSSLSADGLRDLADDIKDKGVRQPIEIRPDGTILDGDRRVQGAKLAGLTEVPVIVRDDVPDDDLVGYILARFATHRRATVEEKVNAFVEARKYLKWKHGKPTGRPKKGAQNRAVFWSPKQIKAEAAKLAGLGSATVADSAVYVFEHADEKLRKLVTDGDLSITAAYQQLRKPKTEDKELEQGEQKGTTGAEDLAQSDGGDGPGADAKGVDASESGATTTASKGATVNGESPADSGDDGMDLDELLGSKSSPQEEPNVAACSDDSEASSDATEDVSDSVGAGPIDTTDNGPDDSESEVAPDRKDDDGAPSTAGARVKARSTSASTAVKKPGASWPTDPTTVRKIVKRLCEGANLLYWIADDKEDDLKAIAEIQLEILEDLMGFDPDAARSWCRAHARELEELVGAE